MIRIEKSVFRQRRLTVTTKFNEAKSKLTDVIEITVKQSIFFD